MQQALGYAESLDVPLAFSSNGDGFLFQDRSAICIFRLTATINSRTRRRTKQKSQRSPLAFNFP
ncbi:MAG: hypothetical protein KKH62_01300 [Gammaproteobacteria bacterium]|nr:hypothetical protein [Gammaproteobacteria bacterium]